MKKLNTSHQVIQRLLEISPRGGAWMRMFFMLILMMMSSALAYAQTKNYNIEVAGVTVSSDNCNNLSVIDGVEGEMSFNTETNTLYLKNVSIDTDKNGIYAYSMKELNIKVEGINSITSSRTPILLNESGAEIYGSGEIRLKTSEHCALNVNNTSLTIDGIFVYAEGKWGMAGEASDKDIITVRNAYVEATGNSGSVCDLKSLILEGCSITAPEGAVFDAAKKSVVLNGNVVTDKVIIEPDNGITIAGEKVTILNCKDLSVIDGVDGKISYNPETKTLTMEDVTINATDIEGIVNNYVKDLKIEVVGNNTITTNLACIALDALSTISGSGTLRLKSSGNCGLYLPYSSLTVEGVKLYAEGEWGIAGYDGNSGELLTLRNAYVEATGSKGSICDLQKLVLDGCSITQPTDAAFDENVHAVALNGELVTDKVVIEPDMYGIRIAGEEVTTLNCAELSYIDGINCGEMSYDPKTNTLMMKEVSFSPSSTDCAIENYGCANLNIKVTGYVGIQTTEAECICLDEATTISGTGTIVTESEENEGIIFRKSLTIDGIRLYGENKCGITGDNGDKEVLTVRNAYVKVGAISNIKSLVLDGSSIVQPEGAAFDATLKGVAFEGDLATDVLIKPTDYFGIEVAGVMVTKANCADLSVLDGVTGKLSYDPMTNTITMQDCTISTTTSDAGLSTEEGKDLKVEVIGNNSITAIHGAIMLNGTTTISGSGTLSVKCSNNTAIYARTPSLTIDGIRLIVEGEWRGITGFDGQTEVITVRNAYVEVTGKLGSIDDIKDLVLEGCSIVQPNGAAFDATLKGVALNGELVKDKVVIEPDASGINDITADVPARKKGIFTVQGVKQTQSWNELPAGVYIVDGVKRVKR